MRVADEGNDKDSCATSEEILIHVRLLSNPSETLLRQTRSSDSRNLKELEASQTGAEG